MKNRNFPGEDNHLAGLLADACHKIQHGSITIDEFAQFTQRKNPFNVEFERNEYGHIVLAFEGIDLTGEEEIERFLRSGLHVSDRAMLCLTSAQKDDYDKNHRLIAGQQYEVALMSTREIERVSDRTTSALRLRGHEHYGYAKPPAGIIPRIREIVSNKQMKDMGFWDIAAPHDAIKNSRGVPSILTTSCLLGDKPGISATPEYSRYYWNGFNAFAFLVPAPEESR